MRIITDFDEAANSCESNLLVILHKNVITDFSEVAKSGRAEPIGGYYWGVSDFLNGFLFKKMNQLRFRYAPLSQHL